MTLPRAATLTCQFLGIVAGAAIIALLDAACWVRSNDGFGRADLIPMGIWSALFGAVLAPVGFTMRRLHRRERRAGRAVAATLLGLLLGAAWTRVMMWMMGPWIGQLSPPVLPIMASAGALVLGTLATLPRQTAPRDSNKT